MKFKLRSLLIIIPAVLIFQDGRGLAQTEAEVEANPTNNSVVNESATGVDEAAFEALQLTPEQVQKWSNLFDLFQNPILPLYDDLAREEDELEQLLASPAGDIGAIREQYRLVETIRQAISRLDFEYQVGLREILTPEQRPQVWDYIDQLSD